MTADVVPSSVADYQFPNTSAYIALSLRSGGNSTTEGSTGLQVASEIFGWAYALSWTFSFYFKVFVWSFYTWERFAPYQLLGFILYTIFNLIFLWIPSAQETYTDLVPKGRVPVETYDAIYSVHSVIFLSLLMFTQCWKSLTGPPTYSILFDEEDDIRRRLGKRTILCCIIGFTVFAMFMAWFGVFSWILFYVMLAYPVLIISWTEIFYYIHVRTMDDSGSCIVISIFALTFTGGLACILQMILTAAAYNDWYTLLGNLPKFGMGMAAVVFTFVVYTGPLIQSGLGSCTDSEESRLNRIRKIADLRRRIGVQYKAGDLTQTIGSYKALHKLEFERSEKDTISGYLKHLQELSSKRTKAASKLAKETIEYKYEARDLFLECYHLLINFPIELSNDHLAAELLVTVSGIYEQTGFGTEAIARCRDAISHNPRNYEAQVRLGKLLISRSAYAEGIRALRAALGISSKDSAELRDLIEGAQATLNREQTAQQKRQQEKYWKEYDEKKKAEQERQRQKEQAQQQQRKREQQQQRKRPQEPSRNSAQARPKTNYEILGVPTTANQNEIRAAFREKLKMYHPDKHPDPELKKYFDEKTAEVLKAYEALRTLFI